MHNKINPFFRSSSFVMAVIFTILLSISLGLIWFLLHARPEVASRQTVLTAVLAALFMIMLTIALLAFVISLYVVKRIQSIAQTATEISQTGNLSARIPMPTDWDDLSQLAIVLNQMLEHIELGVHGVKQVTDNIAHDLRTPLTRLRQRIESTNHPDQEMLLRETDHLLSMFNGLLRIARIERLDLKSQFQPTDLRTIVQDVIELYEPIAEQKEQQLISCLQNATVMGDRDLLFQAFANLLDNAIKFTPHGHRIWIDLKPQTKVVLLRIADEGIGIPPPEIENVFRKFYRLETSRTTEGFGLGLSLVAAIVTQHEADIHLSNRTPNGLVVEIHFPLMPLSKSKKIR